jgi:hypothetical protein
MGASRLQHPVTPTRVAWTVVITGIVIAILGSAFFLLRSRGEKSLNGDWIARMQRPGHAAYILRLRLEIAGETLTGTVEGKPIINGTLKNGKLDFSSGDTNFHGDLRGREIDLTATNADEIIARGPARKTE